MMMQEQIKHSEYTNPSKQTLRLNKTIKKLEFDVIRTSLAEHCATTMAKERALSLVPQSSVNEVISLQELTAEAVALLLAHGSTSVGNVSDLRESVKMAQIGSMLTPKKLLEIADTLRAVRKMRAFFTDKSESYPVLAGMASMLEPAPQLEKDIEMCIVGENQISDHASSTLASIRRKIEQKQGAIRDKLNAMITSAAYSKYLQDSIITIRNDRFVIPVKAEHKGNVSGMIHDQSSKGSTFYIEPMAVVNLNNELTELALKEQEEITVILYRLSAAVAAVGGGITMSAQILADIDFALAKGKLALAQKAIKPEISREKYIKLRKGRHPMIPSDRVVPSNVWIGREFTSLLITGPNTGGKTVTLKTVGLLSLMAQSGLHVPADYGTVFCILDQIYADIGDEQSISQSLSTFSAHMTNIVSILEEVTSNSLVLLDELGAGTDPTEGAALAISILESLRKRGILTMATTHYAELKHYALTKEGVENASVEFDVETLSPTYKLLVGIPGKSNAFEISKKLGLSTVIIEDARGRLATESVDFENVLAKVEQSRQSAEKDRDEALRIRLESERIRKKLDEREQSWSEQREKIMGDARREAKALIKKARQEADELVKIAKSGVNSAYEQQKKKLREVQAELEVPIFDRNAQKEGEADVLNEGDKVFLLTLKKEAVVTLAPNERGQLQVAMGAMKMMVDAKQVQLLERSGQISTDAGRSSYVSPLKSQTVRPEIDVRGMNIEDASMVLDKYIDEVLASSLNKVRIIHGKGTGALKKGLLDYFKRHPNVKSYEDAAYNEGGGGATNIVVG